MRLRSLRARIEGIEVRVAATALEKEAQTRAPRDITNSIATGKEPRGHRYRHSSNDWVWEFITKELRYLDHEETCTVYRDMMRRDDLQNDDKALLACNDRFFLLTELLGRTDMHHPWFFNVCREVEAEPDGRIDLWARAHGKTTIITVAGTLQEIFCDPEITIAIFSATKPLAQEILGQIKNEFETNECLKETFKDVLYENPRGKGPDGRPAKWSLERGITVKRKGKPKEATIEAHGLIDGQPTGRHFKMHVYDDIVTQDYLSDELLKKTTERFELADNLGTRHGVRKWIVGTRYSFADTYGAILDKKAAKPRINPATEDGTLNGRPILLTPENWARIKRDQGTKIVSAQMLLNPLAGSENLPAAVARHLRRAAVAAQRLYPGRPVKGQRCALRPHGDRGDWHRPRRYKIPPRRLLPSHEAVRGLGGDKGPETQVGKPSRRADGARRLRAIRHARRYQRHATNDAGRAQRFRHRGAKDPREWRPLQA